jgi:NhaP-type Na+/H+ or K+/H+ antiporter
MAAFVFACWMVIIGTERPMFADFPGGSLLITDWTIPMLALVVMAAALARMLWIFLALYGDDEEPLSWRYRDR